MYKVLMEAEGYQVTENVFYQDNKSAILLENNGKSSSIKLTKHINICLFFITHRISNKELNVDWCPTNYVIGYFITEQLPSLRREFPLKSLDTWSQESS